MREDQINWLLASDEPWTRYRTLLDLLDQDCEEEEVQKARATMIAHPHITQLITSTADWPGYALKRHNDAKHPLHQLSTLADFGLRHCDPGMPNLISRVMENQAPEGPFQTLAFLYKRFAGVEGEHWTWVMCDAPTILYSLMAFGIQNDPQLEKAMEHLTGIIRENGFPCAGGEPLGPSFKGPGKREHPCPYANLISLKAIAQNTSGIDPGIYTPALEMLLRHWDQDFERKLFLFGTGSKFRKLKYPFVWYDILHVAEVLSLFPSVHGDQRYISMLNELDSAADEMGRYTATSMYQAWKGWSFANKKEPSPWLTFLVLRILKRVGRLESP